MYRYLLCNHILYVNGLFRSQSAPFSEVILRLWHKMNFTSHRIRDYAPQKILFISMFIWLYWHVDIPFLFSFFICEINFYSYFISRRRGLPIQIQLLVLCSIFWMSIGMSYQMIEFFINNILDSFDVYLYALLYTWMY